MKRAPDERAVVRQFYDYQPFRLEVGLRMRLAYALLAVGAFAVGAPGVGWLMVFVASVAYLVRDVLIARARRKFGELAVKTRRIQAQDAREALVRIFKRTQLNLDELRTLKEVYQFEKERDLFQEVSLEERIGEIFNKSIRMWSHGERGAVQWRRVIWDDGRSEMFYNPVRVVALFMSADAVVVCDAEVDSTYFSLKENILRMMVEDIVSIQFHARDERFNLPESQIVNIAEQLEYSSRELRELREDLLARAERDPKYLQEEVGASLKITQTDGGTMEFPICSNVTLLRPGEVAEHRASRTELSADDRTIDRMMNELTRIVTSAKQRKPLEA